VIIDFIYTIIRFTALIFVVIAPFLFAVLALCLLRQKAPDDFKNHQRVYSVAGLYLGLTFSLFILMFIDRSSYDTIINALPNFDILLALFGISIAIFYAVDAIIDNNKFQKTVLQELQSMKKNSSNNEDVRIEINLHAIELKRRLNRIEEKIERIALMREGESNGIITTNESEDVRKINNSLYRRFRRWTDKYDTDGPRWKQMGEIYMGFGAFAGFIEVVHFFWYYDPSIWRDVGFLQHFSQSLLNFFSTISPGVTILGVGLAIYAFGVSLIENQKGKN
jgi:rRNA-processing protein FCF1